MNLSETIDHSNIMANKKMFPSVLTTFSVVYEKTERLMTKKKKRVLFSISKNKHKSLGREDVVNPVQYA